MTELASLAKSLSRGVAIVPIVNQMQAITERA